MVEDPEASLLNKELQQGLKVILSVRKAAQLWSGAFVTDLPQTQLEIHKHTSHVHRDRWTHPDPHEAVSEYNPRQQEYKGLVTTEERWRVCCVDLPEGLQVQVVGEDPQQAKWSYLGEKHPGRQPFIPEKTTTLPAQKQKQSVKIETCEAGCQTQRRPQVSARPFLHHSPDQTETASVSSGSSSWHYSKHKRNTVCFSNMQSAPQLWAELQIFKWIPSEMKDYTKGVGVQLERRSHASPLHPSSAIPSPDCTSWESRHDVCKKTRLWVLWRICSHLESHILYFCYRL